MTPEFIFGQRETGWADWPINKTSSTIGRYGCTTDAYGVGLGYYLGKSMNPKETEIFLREHNAYQKDLVFWPNVPYFRWRFYCVDSPAPIEDIKNELRAGKMVLLHVDLVGNDSKPDHWVLCLDENLTIFDPWYKEIAPFTKRYGDPSRGIYGGAYFNWPDKVSNQPIKTITMEEIFSNIFIAWFERWPTAQELEEFKQSEDYSRPYTYAQKKWIHEEKRVLDERLKEINRLYQSEKDKDAKYAELQKVVASLNEEIEKLKQSGSTIQSLQDQINEMNLQLDNVKSGKLQAENDAKQKADIISSLEEDKKKLSDQNVEFEKEIAGLKKDSQLTTEFLSKMLSFGDIFSILIAKIIKKRS